MRILMTMLMMWVVALPANAKCTLKDFSGDWRVVMTLIPLMDPTGEAVAQQGGEIACSVNFDKKGQMVPRADNRCQQSGLNYSFGQIRAGSVQQPVTVPATQSCRFQIVLDFDRDSSDQTQTVTLANIYLDQVKVGFASDVDVAEPDDEVWHAGTAWGFKPAR